MHVYVFSLYYSSILMYSFAPTTKHAPMQFLLVISILPSTLIYIYTVSIIDFAFSALNR